MIDIKTKLGAVLLCGMLAACDANLPESSATARKSPPVSMDGAACALVPEDGESGSWGSAYKLSNCLRKLAYEDWQKASAEAAHIAGWELGNGPLREMTDSLMRYESSAAVEAGLKGRGLLGGPGDEGFLEYRDDDWQPVTVADWLQKDGYWYSFDVETGMHPNYHDALLDSLAELFGAPLNDVVFAETAPEWDSEAPYKLHAALGDRKWDREADNYGDWYDVQAVLQMLNEMASDLGLAGRAMPLDTYDQTAIVIVAPGDALIAAAADGLIYPMGASQSMDRGKAFEDEIRKLYQVQ